MLFGTPYHGRLKDRPVGAHNCPTYKGSPERKALGLMLQPFRHPGVAQLVCTVSSNMRWRRAAGVFKPISLGRNNACGSSIALKLRSPLTCGLEDLQVAIQQDAHLLYVHVGVVSCYQGGQRQRMTGTEGVRAIHTCRTIAEVTGLETSTQRELLCLTTSRYREQYFLLCWLPLKHTCHKALRG